MAWRAIVSALLLLTLSVAASAEIYQWRDANGQLHFTSRKPPGQAQKVETSRSNTYSDHSDEIPLTPEKPKVVMYTTDWCGYCKKARHYFRKNDIAYTEYDIEKNARAAKRYKTFNTRAVPVIFVNDTRLNGFSRQRFSQVYQAFLHGGED